MSEKPALPPKAALQLDAPRDVKNARGVRRALVNNVRLRRPTFSSSV